MPKTPESTLTAADIGKQVWALIDAPPLLLCCKCGAPQRRCEHEDSWAQSDIPAIVQGTLTAIEIDHERAVPTFVVDGAGITPPIGAYRSEADAKTAIQLDHGDELALLIRWASMVSANV